MLTLAIVSAGAAYFEKVDNAVRVCWLLLLLFALGVGLWRGFETMPDVWIGIGISMLVIISAKLTSSKHKPDKPWKK
jgi:hypothetical protein